MGHKVTVKWLLSQFQQSQDDGSLTVSGFNVLADQHERNCINSVNVYLRQLNMQLKSFFKSNMSSSDSPSSLLHLWSCHSRPGSRQGSALETQSRYHPLDDHWCTNHHSRGGVNLKGEVAVGRRYLHKIPARG